MPYQATADGRWSSTELIDRLPNIKINLIRNNFAEVVKVTFNSNEISLEDIFLIHYL